MIVVVIVQGQIVLIMIVVVIVQGRTVLTIVVVIVQGRTVLTMIVVVIVKGQIVLTMIVVVIVQGQTAAPQTVLVVATATGEVHATRPTIRPAAQTATLALWVLPATIPVCLVSLTATTKCVCVTPPVTTVPAATYSAPSTAPATLMVKSDLGRELGGGQGV